MLISLNFLCMLEVKLIILDEHNINYRGLYMGSPIKCDELISFPSYFVQTDLLELESRFLDELLRDSRELYESMRKFERYCAGSMTRNVYDFGLSMFHLALLKLSTALESKLKGSQVRDEFTEYILKYYTLDERNSLRELERFSKLDPNVTPPEVLADIIVAEEGEVYRLVRDAVSKEYVDLARVLKTWESELRVRNHITRAFISVYQARFQNIIKAIELLLRQQPAWLKRLFKEYENALLKSAEVRARFEEEFKRVFGEEVSKLESVLRSLESENSNLRRRLEDVSVRLALTEEEKKKHEEDLARIRAEYELLHGKYESVLTDFNKKLAELESLRRDLLEKERELEKLRNSEASASAARIALENEIDRLRESIANYERRLQEYRELESRVKELKLAIEGKSTGNLVRREEVDYYYEVVAGRSRRMLEDRRVNIFDPRISDYVVIDRWSKIERFDSFSGEVASPLILRGILFTRLTGLLSKKRDFVIEYVLLTHFTDSGREGFDTQPVSLSEFTSFWRRRVYEAEEEKYYHVMIICSPTGFSEELVRYVSGGTTPWGAIASRYVTVYLLDLIKGRAYYNYNDPAAKNNSFLANVELPEEQVERVVNYLLSDEAKLEALKRSPAVRFLSISDISKGTGVSDVGVLRRALSSLEERGLGQVKVVGNELVFVYREL